MDWFRSYHDAPIDPKWRVIARDAHCRTGEVAAIFWRLLDLASQSAERGVVFHDAAEREGRISEIAASYDFEESLVGGVIAAMERRKIILDGRLPTWGERQPKRNDDSSDRTKEWRRRTRGVTDGDAPVTPRGDERREEERESILPMTESTTARAREPARIIVDRFLEEREKHWPRDSRLPAPLMTLLTQAKNYLAQGATVELCAEVIARVARRKSERGETRPPTDLGFCVATMETEIGKLKRAATTLREVPAAAPAGPERGDVVWRGRLEMWLTKGTWFDRTWNIGDCPAELLQEFDLQLRAKPPPGYRQRA